MMVKTEFKDGVETPQDLIDRDMSLGKIYIVDNGSKIATIRIQTSSHSNLSFSMASTTIAKTESMKDSSFLILIMTV